VRAKTYLQQVRLLDTRIETNLEEYERLKAMATKVTAVLSGEVVSRTRNNDTMADTIEKIIKLQDILNRDIDRYVDLKKEVLAVLSNVENPLYYQILYDRYILFKTWEQIACEQNYTYRGITKIHGKALVAFERILEKCS
jgi:hypothetical protein